MASIKVKFRPSTASGREGSIYYQVIHGRIVRQVKTDYRIFDTEWDKKNFPCKNPARNRRKQKTVSPRSSGTYRLGHQTVESHSRPMRQARRNLFR